MTSDFSVYVVLAVAVQLLGVCIQCILPY